MEKQSSAERLSPDLQQQLSNNNRYGGSSAEKAEKGSEAIAIEQKKKKVSDRIVVLHIFSNFVNRNVFQSLTQTCFDIPGRNRRKRNVK